MFGDFFKRRNKPDILGLIELLKVKVVEMSKEIDMINEKLRSPLIKKKLQELQEQEEKNKELNPAVNEPTDGFDNIRRLRKDLNISPS